MGKQKRARQKYHIACVKSRKEELENSKIEPVENKALEWKVTPEDNIFAGLNINIDGLKKSLQDDDVKSIKSMKSISKSIKSNSESRLKKSDKRKLRHNLFIKKIDDIYKNMKDSKGKKKKGTTPETNQVSKVEYLFSKNPVKVKQPQPTSLKQKGIKKAKQRKQELLNNIKMFTNALTDFKLTERPFDVISSSIKTKINTNSI